MYAATKTETKHDPYYAAKAADAVGIAFLFGSIVFLLIVWQDLPCLFYYRCSRGFHIVTIIRFQLPGSIFPLGGLPAPC
ncbi:hypothetical protein ALCH109712_16330 [Alkalicoccus chagannorensis]